MWSIDFYQKDWVRFVSFRRTLSTEEEGKTPFFKQKVADA
jgi:hypothetical protein